MLPKSSRKRSNTLVSAADAASCCKNILLGKRPSQPDSNAGPMLQQNIKDISMFQATVKRMQTNISHIMNNHS